MRLFDRYLQSVKEIPEDRLDAFCAEIRSFLIKNVAKTGGHLASNLGVVELTVALHRVFDTASDRIVFDVGHQCYVHKLLTGRKDGFPNMRSFGGMSGFPKPGESVHDAFAAGHASTSVSAALGFARARTLLKEGYHCVAVLGDGALTGGLAYEGLNDAGQSGEPLIVVLNDNGMSIKKNVGGVARHLTKLRLQPRYFNAKRFTHRLLDPLPAGRAVARFLHRGKEFIKNAVIPGSLFAQMGFEYLGPTDGHDIKAVTNLFRQAATLKKPVLIHLVTQKGRGYAFSENNPSKYHGVKSFRVAYGVGDEAACDAFSRRFGDILTNLAETDRKIVAVTAAMQTGTGLDRFAERFPHRFFDVGIAESHAVTMAAAMAKQGLRPVVAVYSTFLQRAYDQIVHDVALQNLPVVFVVSHAGLCGEDGETHHGVFDPFFLASVPNLTLRTPCTAYELDRILMDALNGTGPVAIRIPKTPLPLPDLFLPARRCREGSDATILTYGGMTGVALETAERLTGTISVGVTSLTSLKPLPEVIPTEGEVFILEDNPGFLAGKVKGVAINTGDRFIPQGSEADLLRFCRLDAASVSSLIASAFGRDRRYG
ncbi:MAG: 1-deoxy-D-xylulose-5-phosphate synthase [Oscillospiraceae bacterium]|jgi:1-deoxy-D-xylulose-5-phosphate synthase|nr:1-deoxy-D-xylulose-5-phosphate synthase [Oscillospiraceae bacterium]